MLSDGTNDARGRHQRVPLNEAELEQALPRLRLAEHEQTEHRARHDRGVTVYDRALFISSGIRFD
jgi:hypothetical protein